MKRPCLNFPNGIKQILGIGLVILLAMIFSFVTLTTIKWVSPWLEGPIILGSVFIQAVLIIATLGISGIIK